AQVDAARRQRLLNHHDAKVRERAAKLFAATGDRAKVVEAYRDVLSLAGDVTRGRAVFLKSCATCHRLEGAGHAVGPDLTTAAGKTGLYFLTEILDPNRTVDSRYMQYVALTAAGRTFTGVLASETATGVTIRGPDGAEQQLLRTDLDELRNTG